MKTLVARVLCCKLFMLVFCRKNKALQAHKADAPKEWAGIKGQGKQVLSGPRGPRRPMLHVGRPMLFAAEIHKQTQSLNELARSLLRGPIVMRAPARQPFCCVLKLQTWVGLAKATNLGINTRDYVRPTMGQRGPSWASSAFCVVQ